MKKIIFMVATATLFLSSCNIVTKTAKTQDVDSKVVQSYTEADLVIPEKKAFYTLNPTGDVQRSGAKNIKETAIAELLKENGNADVLVCPSFEITTRKGKIKQIVVSGYPARYKNFKSKSAQENK